MFFYEISYGSYEDSRQLFVFSEEYLPKNELHNRVILAGKDLLEAKVFEEYTGDNDLGSINISDLIGCKLYSYLVKYNLHKVEIPESINYFGWHSINLPNEESPKIETHFWKDHSDKYNKEFFDMMKQVISNKFKQPIEEEAWSI